ncbi:DUF6150 family protein [Taibaiella soli]|nr:DUF6150 family protein [Taibaiella soli]
MRHKKTTFSALCSVISVMAIVVPFSSPGQKIYSTTYKGDADVKVYVTKWKSEADLVVYKAKYSSEVDARDNNGIWFFTEYKGEAKKTIYFTEWKSDADLIIYFTEWKSEAGWQNKKRQALLY